MGTTNNSQMISADVARTLLKWTQRNISELDKRIAEMNGYGSKKTSEIRFKNVYQTHTHDVSVLRDFAKELEPLAIPSALEEVVNKMREMGLPSNTIESVIADYVALHA